MRRGKRKRGKIEKERESSQSAIRSENLMVKQRLIIGKVRSHTR